MIKHLGILLAFLCTAACSTTQPPSSRSNDFDKQIRELQQTLRIQNAKIEELNNKVTLLSDHHPSNQSSEGKLSGVSIGEEPLAAPGKKTLPPASDSPASDQSAMTVTALPKPQKPVREPVEAASSDEAAQIYFAALKRIEKHQLEEGKKALVDFIKKFPQHVFSDNAVLELGKICLEKKQYEQALFYFKQLQGLYPDGDKVVSSYFNMGIALRALKRDTEAREIFRSLILKFPGSEEAQLAEQVLKKQT